MYFLKWTAFCALMILFLFFQKQQPTYLLLGKEPDCFGYNICAMSNEPLQSDSSMLMLKVFVSKTKKQKLQIQIPKPSINDRFFFLYFSTGFFAMEQGYKVPGYLVNQIGFQDYFIKPGKYKIESDSEYYYITF